MHRTFMYNTLMSKLEKTINSRGKDLDWSAVGLGTPHGWISLNQRVDTCYKIPFPSGALASK